MISSGRAGCVQGYSMQATTFSERVSGFRVGRPRFKWVVESNGDGQLGFTLSKLWAMILANFCGCEVYLESYMSDMKVKKFLHIIENSPVYPVIYDSRRRVLSVPPIINGAHSAISLKTKNVLIECTATDLTPKAKIVLNTMYSSPRLEVEPVEVVTADAKSTLHPDLSLRTFEVGMAYINRTIRTSLTAKEVAKLLNKMQLHTEVQSESRIRVSAPPTRSDVLHA